MTPDELRARCEQWVEQQDSDWSGVLANVESLCREMIASGLERAAVEMVNSGNDKLTGWIEWCQQEAQRLKNGEGPLAG